MSSSPLIPRAAPRPVRHRQAFRGASFLKQLNRREKAETHDRPSPVHSAHVGQEAEVYYRCHPHFGQKVLVRRVKQRASDLFLPVQAPSGVVISMAGWMFDPVHYAGMTSGSPRVDVTALIELERLLSGADKPARSRSDVVIVLETQDGFSQATGRGAGSADQLLNRPGFSGGSNS